MAPKPKSKAGKIAAARRYDVTAPVLYTGHEIGNFLNLWAAKVPGRLGEEMLEEAALCQSTGVVPNDMIKPHEWPQDNGRCGRSHPGPAPPTIERGAEAAACDRFE